MRLSSRGTDKEQENKTMEKIEMKEISEVKEVFSEDEANLLMKEGWKYLSVNTSSHPTSYILCRTTTREQE